MPLFVLGVLALSLSACSSGQKQRLEQREKIAAASGMYCDFINGDEHKDVEVELNMSIGRRCDGNKPFSMTSYKNASEVHGIVYCCSSAPKRERESTKDKTAEKSKDSGLTKTPELQ